MRVSDKDLQEFVQQLANRSGKALELRMAYGKVGLSGPGGRRDISPLMTRPELYNFLRGLSEGLDLVGK